MTRSEAGKLGAIASAKSGIQLKEKRLKEYYCNPKHCDNCKIVISYEKRYNKFCTHTCAAIKNNTKRGITNETITCLGCSKIFIKNCYTRSNNYCSRKCFQENRKSNNLKTMLETGIDTSSNCRQSKKYIIETYGHQCQICNRTEWDGNKIPLVLDHINGNSGDCSLINLRVICRNCDVFTPFFCSKNVGNGRHKRRQRYAEGKSY